MNPIPYLMKRIEERSTWAGIAIAVTGASALSSPYSWIVIALGVVGVLAPTPGNSDA